MSHFIVGLPTKRYPIINLVKDNTDARIIAEQVKLLPLKKKMEHTKFIHECINSHLEN